MKERNVELKAPPGKFRVVVEDPFSHEMGLVDDYDNKTEALNYVETENSKRTGAMDGVHWVYDENGVCISDHQNVSR